MYLFLGVGVESIEVDTHDWGLYTCGGYSLQATLKQGNDRICKTDVSGSFSGGDRVWIPGGDCKHTKFDVRKSIHVRVRDTTSNFWCTKASKGLNINMEQGIKLFDYFSDSSAMGVSHSTYTSKTFEMLPIYRNDLITKQKGNRMGNKDGKVAKLSKKSH